MPPMPVIGIPLSANPAYHQFGEELAGYFMALMCSTKNAYRFKLMMNFIGISRPFCDLKYQKVTEFKCKKQSQGRLNDGWFMRNVKSVFSRWQTRWIVLSSTSLFYYETPEDKGDKMKDSVTFDSDTQVVLGECSSSYFQIQFKLSRRVLLLEIPGSINGIINLHYIAKLFKKSPYAHTNRFKSFAPIRERNDCMFFPDGEGYYDEMRKAIEKSRDDVMITDWWFSPELPLTRPIQDTFENESSRIDRVLQSAAKRGVKVYVIVYKEFSMTLSNDSEYVKETLEKLSPNIKVLRHPNVIVSLWSHHEKMCVVDKKTVFMGGLDLCWGRFDYQEHPLFNDPQAKYFPGADYYNPLKRDITKGRNYSQCMIDQNYPRMPWHDVAVMLKGQVARDFTSHFVMYWNHARETNSESEVLFSKKVGAGLSGEEKFQAKVAEFRNMEGNEEELEGIDPYEANPGIDLGVLQGISAINIAPGDNSVFDPQASIFNFINNKDIKEGSSFDKSFIDRFRAENDRIMSLTESKTELTEEERKLEQMIAGLNIPTITKCEEDNLMPPIISFSSENQIQNDFMMPPPIPIDYNNGQPYYNQECNDQVPIDQSDQRSFFISGNLQDKEPVAMNSLLLCGNNAEDNDQSVAPAQPTQPEANPIHSEPLEAKKGIFKTRMGKKL